MATTTPLHPSQQTIHLITPMAMIISYLISLPPNPDLTHLSLQISPPHYYVKSPMLYPGHCFTCASTSASIGFTKNSDPLIIRP